MELVKIVEKVGKANNGFKTKEHRLLVEMTEEEFVELKGYLMSKEAKVVEEGK